MVETVVETTLWNFFNEFEKLRVEGTNGYLYYYHR